MTDQRDFDGLTAGLGSQWETLALGSRSMRPSAIRPGLALLEAIPREHRLSAGAIERIEVDCTKHCRDHVAWPYVPKGVASAQMNIYYALSAMALERGHDRAVRRGQARRSAHPRFMRRIAVTPSAEYDAMGNAYRCATRVTVIATQGDRRAREMLYRRARPRRRSPAPHSKTSPIGWRRAR